MTTGYYQAQSHELRERLRVAVDRATLRDLHRLSPVRHLAIGIRHFVIYAALTVLLARFDSPWIWAPLAAVQGIVLLGFVILLHEVVHNLVVSGARPAWVVWLGRAYAFPTGISAAQFDRWHNDHHRELGDASADPKRAHLSPRRNARWFKLLYFTPALFLIYARAAGLAARSYDDALRRRIRTERLANVALHALLVAGLASYDPAAVFRAWAAPLFLFFPVAFAVNRLGQHYDIDPERVEAWSTRVDGNAAVRAAFLASNHHIEHHYFPKVPLYRLAALNRALRPFFESSGIRNRGYAGLLFDWFVRNRRPHTDWRRSP